MGSGTRSTVPQKDVLNHLYPLYDEEITDADLFLRGVVAGILPISFTEN